MQSVTRLEYRITELVVLTFEEPNPVKGDRKRDEYKDHAVEKICRGVHPVELIANQMLISRFLFTASDHRFGN